MLSPIFFFFLQSFSKAPVDEWFPFKDYLFLRFNRHERRCISHEPLNVPHAGVPASRKAQCDTHLIFNDAKVLVEIHNSESHWRQKEKDSEAFWLPHVLAQICFSFSMLHCLCLSVFRSSAKSPPQHIPPHRTLGGLYVAVGSRSSIPLPGNITMTC